MLHPKIWDLMLIFTKKYFCFLFFFGFGGGVSLESLFLILLASICPFIVLLGVVRKLHSLPALGFLLFLFLLNPFFYWILPSLFET